MISQLQLLNKIISDKDFSIISTNNLTENHFFNYKTEFNFIKNHYDVYKVVPDKLTFQTSFPDFEFVEVNEPKSFLLEQLFTDYDDARLGTGFNQLKKFLEAGESEKAMNYFKHLTETIQKATTISCTNLLEDTGRFASYEEKMANRDKYYLSTGFPELDDIIGGIDRKEENMVIIARTGQGKCLAKGTKVLMADGTIKAVENVEVGDKLQSFNRINTVQALHNGHSNGYKIIPNKGEPFIVSANHILTLYKYNEVYDKARHIMTTNGTGELVDITIEDYLALSNHKKRLYKLIRPAIEYSTKEQIIPAYILGLWLGDVTSSEPQICSTDTEIVSAIYEYGDTCNYTINKIPSHANDSAPIYSITGMGNTNKSFRANLQELQLLNNKHIPLQYLTGDRQQRLALLAGLLDTDGCYMHYSRKNSVSSMFDFTNKNKVLFEQVVQLARGLGFKVCIPKTKKIITSAGEIEYYRMNISGDLYTIPTKIARKQAVKTKHQNSLLYGFTVEPVEEVEYYGFMADGDHRYLLADNTLTHNTQFLIKLATAASVAGLRVGIYEGEMSPDKVGYRVDTFLGGISNTGMNRGDVSIHAQYKNYINKLREKNYGPILVFTPNDVPGEKVTVDTLQAFIESHKIDILFIDQYDLLDDRDFARTDFEHVANIAKDIKKLQVRNHIPIISVSQMNRTKNEDKDGNKQQDTTQIAGSDKIGRYATIVLALEQKKIDSEKNPEEFNKLHGLPEFDINIIKARDGGDGNKLVYGVDFDHGKFIHIDESKPDAQEAAKLQARYED